MGIYAYSRSDTRLILGKKTNICHALLCTYLFAYPPTQLPTTHPPCTNLLPIYLPTNPGIYLPIYLITHPPTYPLAYPWPAHPPTYLPTYPPLKCQPTRTWPAYLPTYLTTHPPIHLLTYPFTHLPILSTYLLTYIHFISYLLLPTYFLPIILQLAPTS
jgi:hypothetical protein